MADIKWSQFPSVTPGSADEVVGLHSGGNARFSLANLVYAVRNGLGNIFQSKITANGILKGDGQGGVTAATAGTDYATPAQLEGKAAKADLTNIHATGSTNTTGARILANKYFYLNGTLVQAITDIPNGGSFTSGTNYEAVVDGGLNNLKTLVGNYIKYVSPNSNANIILPRGNAFIAITLNAYYGIRSCVILSRYISGNSLRIDHIVTDSRHTWTAVDSSTVNVATSYGECQVFFTRIA